jgi:hypothetical protein
MIKIEEPHLLFEKTPVYKISQRNKEASSAPFNVKSAKLLLVFATKEQVVSPSVQAMFTKLTIACGFTDAQKMLINTGGKSTEAGELIKEYSPKLVLVFGDAVLTGIKPGKNAAEVINGATVISTDGPEILAAHDAGKAALWKAIKAALKL